MKSKGKSRILSARLPGLLQKSLILPGVLVAASVWAQTAVVSVMPDADAFVSSMAPTNNYGGGGALSVSGSAAVNGSAQQNGLFDTLMRFQMSNVVASLDSALGSGNWLITKTRLVVTEMAAPDNAIFNRGVGTFEVDCLATNNWVEGTGTPKLPTTDGVTWNDLPGIVNSNLDTSLGVFTNAGANGQIAFVLALADPFLADIRDGGEVGLHLTAASPSIGFTFNSRNFLNTNAQPVLEITAAVSPMPHIDSIVVSAGYVSVTFGAISNWNYRLQGSTAFGSENWTDLLVVPAQPGSGEVVYQDGVTNQQKFYRLSVSP
jgi:hypothetical protein